MNQVFRGQSLLIEIDMGQDVSGASTPTILYTKPDGTTGSWIATTNVNKLTYAAANGVLDIPGTWQLQGKIYLSGNRYFSGISMMNVENTLQD